MTGPSGRSMATPSTPCSRRTSSRSPAAVCSTSKRAVTTPRSSTMQTAWDSFAQSMPANRRIPSICASSLLQQPGGTLV